MDLKETLLAFGEWLDMQGLVVPESPVDSRSHDQLAQEFIEDWESDPARAKLVGRV